MYTIVANGDNISSGINFYLVDTKEQLNNLYPRPGSKAYVLEDSKTYILTHKKTTDRWVEYKHVLTKYVDESIDKALKNFTGDIDPETIKQMIGEQLDQFAWNTNEAFKTAVNIEIEGYITTGKYVTESQLKAAIEKIYEDVVTPDLSAYLTKADAKRRFVQVNGEVENDIDLVYVAGATLADI